MDNVSLTMRLRRCRWQVSPPDDIGSSHDEHAENEATAPNTQQRSAVFHKHTHGTQPQPLTGTALLVVVCVISRRTGRGERAVSA